MWSIPRVFRVVLALSVLLTSVGAAPSPEHKPEHKAASETPGGGAKNPVASKPSGITQTNNTSWKVTQSLVDQWQENPYLLGNVRESGEGWQLMGVRQRLAYHLGMRNGDIVLEVNGHKLDSEPQLLAAYLACKNDREFDVVFLRNGQRKTHHYSISP
jgi:type II secretory pathway component PulC